MNKKQVLAIIEEDFIKLKDRLNQVYREFDVLDVQVLDKEHALVFYVPKTCEKCMDMLKLGEVEYCESCKEAMKNE